MNKNLLIAVVAVGLLIVIYLIFSSQPQTVPETTNTPVTDQTETQQAVNMISVTLNEQNDSGETGTATLVEENGQVVVTLSTQGSPVNIPQPAHIHVGACPDVGAVAYPLTNVVNGASITTLNVTLVQLESELPLGINVHKSASEAKVYTACGDLAFQ